MTAVISPDQEQRTRLARLNNLGLKGFAQALLRQWETMSVYAQMNFDQRLDDLIAEQEDCARKARASYLEKASKIKTSLNFNDIYVNPDRGFTNDLKTELASLRFISTCTNVIVMGASGSGKSSLIGALGRLCCRSGYITQYYSAIDILQEMHSLSDSFTERRRLRNRLKRVKVLILDDLGLVPLNRELAVELFTILEDRTDSGVTIIGTQLSTVGLAKAIQADQATIDANMRRITEKSIQIELTGNAYSMTGGEPRTPQGGQQT